MSRPSRPDPKDAVPPASGVSEEAVAYEVGPVEGDWSIELARIAEYRRTGIAHDAEPVLEAFLARVRTRGEGDR